jgi:uncharacterized Zn finger protein (UPF0148 family)
MSASSFPAGAPEIKQSSCRVFQVSCSCRSVLHVRDGKAVCTICEVEHSVSAESRPIWAEDPAPAAEEPTITAKEGLA